jgi:hypothetical protein
MPQPRLDELKDTFWRGGLRSDSEIETERAALDAFEDAVALAKEGNYQAARQLCVVVVFLVQPLVSSRPTLLRATLHALLVIHGFNLLSRVVMAINGCRVDVTMLPECIGAVEQPRRHDEPRRTALLLDPRWLARLSPDDPFLDDWCEVLGTGPRRMIATAGLSGSARQLERI